MPETTYFRLNKVISNTKKVLIGLMLISAPLWADNYNSQNTSTQMGDVEINNYKTKGGKPTHGIYHHIYKVVNGKLSKLRPNSSHGHFFCVSGLIMMMPVDCKFNLAAGNYVIKSDYKSGNRDFNLHTPFKIKAGKVTKVDFLLYKKGQVKITASKTKGGKHTTKADHSIYHMANGKAVGKVIKRCRFRGSCTLGFPIGKYIIKSKYKNLNIKTLFTVKADRLSRVNVVLKRPAKISFRKLRSPHAALIKRGSGQKTIKTGVMSFKLDAGARKKLRAKDFVKNNHNYSCAGGAFVEFTWAVRHPYPRGGEDLVLYSVIPRGGGNTEVTGRGKTGSSSMGWCGIKTLWNTSLVDYYVELRYKVAEHLR